MAENLATLTRAEREKRGWSLREAARRLETGFGHLCNIENRDHVNLTAQTLLCIQSVYGVSTRRLWSAVQQSLAEGRRDQDGEA